MAELVASLIGIIGAGTKVAMVLSQVAMDIGSAGKEPLIMAREIRSFCTIIRVLSQTLEGLHSEMTWNNYSACSESISDMMVVSKDMFTEILGLIDSIQKSSFSSSALLSNSKFNLTSRIKWVMNKPKFVFLRSALEAYKSNLSLLIGSIQLSQSLASASPSPDSGEVITPQANTNRASLSLSADLQDIANEYRASMQEMETARFEMENESSFWLPPWESPPEEMTVADPMTMNDQQDPRLREMIAAAEEEVQSLRPSSGVRSNSAASIYSSLSRHSAGMSVIVDQLPMDELFQPSERRNSTALTIRDDRWVPASYILGATASHQEPSASQPTVKLISRPKPTAPSDNPPKDDNQPKDDADSEKAFKELMTKYKNVKRLYFDGKSQIEELNERLSAIHSSSTVDDDTEGQTPSTIDEAKEVQTPSTIDEVKEGQTPSTVDESTNG